jgi:excisionase family DNA binding protein
MQQVEDRYYTPDEVAKRFRVSRRTVDRWIADGDLAAIKFAGRTGRIRIAESDLEAFIRRHRTDHTEGQ